MNTVTSFSAAAMSPDQLNGILADHLALEQTRAFRRLLVVRFGALLLFALLLDLTVRGLSPLVRWTPLVLFVVPPIWAWIAELRLEYRLSRRLDDVDDASTHSLSAEEQVELPDL
jgi:hypothetical protein